MYGSFENARFIVLRLDSFFGPFILHLHCQASPTLYSYNQMWTPPPFSMSSTSLFYPFLHKAN